MRREEKGEEVRKNKKKKRKCYITVNLYKNHSEGCGFFRSRIENYDQRPNFGLLPLFDNKVLLEHKQTYLIRVVYGCFHTSNSRVCSSLETIWPTKAKIII